MQAAADTTIAAAPWLADHVPETLRQVVFLLEHWHWLGLLVLALVGVIVDRVVSVIAFTMVRRILTRMMPRADVDGLRSAVRPLGILSMAIVFRAGLGPLGLTGRILTILDVAVNFLAAGGGVWAAYRFVDIVAAYFTMRADATATKLDDLLVPMARKSLKVFIIAFGLVFIADNLNVDISSLLAGLGLGGLAFALAAQDLVKNLFGSLTVLLDRPFQVGDWVVIGSQEGMVEEVGFRSTRIRTFYNSLITMPNATLISTAVDNYGARQYRRWNAMLSVTYDTPPEKVEAFCEGIRELIRRHPDTRKDYFHVYARDFGAASLDILLYVFFASPDWGKELEARHALFLDILRLSHELGVDFAFPTQTLHVLRPGELPDHGRQPSAAEAIVMGRETAERIAEASGAGPDGR
ncbi:mechanosensitive ion channel family protein [bacterium]|nr:mechanosensitive ion channel family protein [bacterium]